MHIKLTDIVEKNIDLDEKSSSNFKLIFILLISSFRRGNVVKLGIIATVSLALKLSTLLGYVQEYEMQTV